MHGDAMSRLRAANPVATAPAVMPVDDLIAGWGDRVRAADSSVADARVAGSSGSGASTRRRTPWRASGLSIVLALLVMTGSTAAALTAFTGHPIPRSPDTVSIRPAAGSTHVSTVRAVDPDGGPPWTLRIGAATGGLECLGVGQIDDGHFGLVGLDGVFREVTPAGADDCGVPPRGTRSTVETRTFVGTTDDRAVTVIYGVRAPGIAAVTVDYVDGVTVSPPIGPDGAFVVARRGTLDQQRPIVEAQPTGASAAAVIRTTLGTPLPASRARCGTPHEPGRCHGTHPFVASEGVR